MRIEHRGNFDQRNFYRPGAPPPPAAPGPHPNRRTRARPAWIPSLAMATTAAELMIDFPSTSEHAQHLQPSLAACNGGLPGSRAASRKLQVLPSRPGGPRPYSLGGGIVIIPRGSDAL